MDIRRQLLEQLLIPGEVVVVHQGLQPVEDVAGVKGLILGVLHDPGPLAKILFCQPRVIPHRVVVHQIGDQVVAVVANRFLMLRRVEMMGDHADLRRPARALVKLVQRLVAASERPSVLDRLGEKISGDIQDFHRRSGISDHHGDRSKRIVIP